MSTVTPEEEKAILNSSPKGTYALLMAYGAMLLVAWLLLYFGRYMALGPAS